jgi:thiamine-monophosphate kinase
MRGEMFRSEAEFVRWLQKGSATRARQVSLGIGDDAALVRLGRGHDLVLTSDLSIEGVHFLRRLHPPRSVGHRALARALSDIAAMGGTPRFALISLALSKQGETRNWVEGFYAGVRSLASRAGVAIIGGDTALVSCQSFADVVVAGEVPRGAALLRSGARPGDQIFVSGWLGLSALGLRMLKSGRIGSPLAKAIHVHLYPFPRIELGRFLSEKRLASALMDLSDGLSTDLARLCDASGVGAALWSSQIPRPNGSLDGRLSDAAALNLALNGGEDYELLFTVRPGKVSRIPARFRGLPLRRIGEIRPSKGLCLVHPDGTSRALEPGGYDHLRK